MMPCLCLTACVCCHGSQVFVNMGTMIIISHLYFFLPLRISLTVTNLIRNTITTVCHWQWTTKINQYVKVDKQSSWQKSVVVLTMNRNVGRETRIMTEEKSQRTSQINRYQSWTPCWRVPDRLWAEEWRWRFMKEGECSITHKHTSPVCTVTSHSPFQTIKSTFFVFETVVECDVEI